MSSETTRQLLIDAALKAFAEDGVQRASLLEITRQAGQRNRGAVHYHFGSREGMLVAVLEEQVDFLRGVMTDLIARAEARPGELEPLVDGFVDIDGHEAWLHGVHIPEYTQGTWTNHSARRKRTLLLNRDEIDKIERRVNEKGLTVVPLSLYFKDGRAKVEIALAKGKKSWDKRHAIAERTANRETEQAVGRRLKGMSD